VRIETAWLAELRRSRDHPVMTQVELDVGRGAAGGLLERGAELARLSGYVEAIGEGAAGRVVLLGGEAGVGKTALVEALCAAHPELTVLGGECEPLFAPPPLGPLLRLTEQTLVDEGAPPHEIAGALLAKLADEPALFVLEDLHWADEATLDVFRLVARRIETVSCLLVATYRDEALGLADPLRIVLGELGTARSVDRMRLAGLSEAAVVELSEPHGLDGAELYRKTNGNPFFVVEALAAGSDAIPETVRDAVLARAARLSPGARALLDAVAVTPPSTELWLLRALAPEHENNLDECLASGMLRSEQRGVMFRHDLARMAVEEEVPPLRGEDLHRLALAALAEPPSGAPDLARLAHHADAAGDADAVLRYAPPAAARAASLGAHREAAAQYARALRHGDELAPDERAGLLERRSRACYLTDEIDEAIVTGEAALRLRRAAGERLEEGSALRWLAEIHWCPGRTAEAERMARESVALLETLPEGRELAAAYTLLGSHCSTAGRTEEALGWASNGLALAHRLGDTETVIQARRVIGGRKLDLGDPTVLEETLEIAKQSGSVAAEGAVYVTIGGAAFTGRRYDVARRYMDGGIAFVEEHGLELYRYYLLSYRARLLLVDGRWDEAAEAAAGVLRVRRNSIAPHVYALCVLGLVRARRGDPGAQPLLDEGWELAEPTGEPSRLGPPAVARAEAAWLTGHSEAVAAATEAALALAIDRSDLLLAGELELWRGRAGLPRTAPELIEPKPCSAYDDALVLLDSGDEEQLRTALDVLQQLGAAPAAAIAVRRLRELGARGVPRGPRRATLENPAGLTKRELEVLVLVASGLRDSEIAGRLVLSERTVGHHVRAVLRKLGVRNRSQASAEAVRLGLVPQR
jgi:DNA-binding CsgD family transcriptional regulator/tetratricopeptide (TPR) repeat protein